jgi:hypothetical protein
LFSLFVTRKTKPYFYRPQFVSCPAFTDAGSHA